MTAPNEAPPIVVNATPTADQLASLGRTILLLASVVTAVAGLVSKRDLAGFIVYVQSSEFLQAASAVVGIATFVWGQWKTRHRARQLATVAADPRVPDDVATLKPGAIEPR